MRACGSIPIYLNAHLLENSFENDEVLDYVCATGYETEDGDPGYSLICEGGDWIPESGNAPCHSESSFYQYRKNKMCVFRVIWACIN